MTDHAPAPALDEIITVLHPKIVVTAKADSDRVDIYMQTDTGPIHIQSRFISEAMLELRKRVSEQVLRPAPSKGGL